MKLIATLALYGLLAPVAFAQDVSFADLYEKVSASVVTIKTTTLTIDEGVPHTTRGVGSGIVIEEDQIITAAHVVNDATVIDVLFTNGDSIRASVIASLDQSDVALLQLHDPHPNPTLAVLADSDKTRIGSNVFVVGSPFGISQTLSVGHLSGRMSRENSSNGGSIEFLQTDAAINKGNSGGPIFNTDGEVIGVVSFILTKSGGFDGVGFATASNTAKQALMKSSGVLVGFEGIVLNKRLAKLLNFPHPGMLVQRVLSHSAVGKAGLRAGHVKAQIGQRSLLLGGDFILDIEGVIFETQREFDLVIASTLSRKETAYTIRVFRDGKELELVTPDPYEFSTQWDELDAHEHSKINP